MDYKGALAKLERLRVAMSKPQRSREEQDELCVLYGEVEEVVRRFAGDSIIEVPRGMSQGVDTYHNFIEAGYLSDRSIHAYQGYNQLLKVIGKVRQADEDPTRPRRRRASPH